MEYEFSTTKPPVYPLLKEKFGIDWDNGIIITYGKTIHCKQPIPPEKMVHELVHVKQQTNPEEWWNRYLLDKDFRLSQELEAYKKEAQFIKDNIKDRNGRYMYIHQMAKDLSSHIYGNVISFNDAMRELL
jgi:hypothetical protein